MKIIEQSHKIISLPDNPLQMIEAAGREFGRWGSGMTQPFCPECGRPMIFLDENMEFYCPECREREEEEWSVPAQSTQEQHANLKNSCHKK
jgi:uncharacterized Zn finger protein (UPF0148 family)